MVGRIKPVDGTQYGALLRTKWQPVALEGDAIPCDLGSEPESVYCHIIGSGELQAPEPYESLRIPNCERVGGMFAYRVDEMDAPFRINRDDFMLVRSRDSGRLFLEGPFADPEDHWSREIPENFLRVSIAGDPTKAG